VQSALRINLLAGAYLAVAAWHLAALFWLRASLLDLDPWLFAVVTAAACFLPMAVFLYLAARWLYATGLNGRARVMIELTPA
jgi:hypothetical protein